MLRRIRGAVLLLLALAAPALAQNPNPSFNIVNRGRADIKEVYATPAGMTTWGRDRLARAPVQPGQNAPVRLPADGNCVYDIRVIYADGRSEEQRGLNTCTMDNVLFPPAARGSAGRPATDDPSFRLVNRGRSPVDQVYATLTGVESWGEDRLGDATVAPGQSKVIRLPSGSCLYDVRIVYANGEATEKRRVNLCTITDLRVP